MELYHLAGQSHVGLSFEIPESTCEEAGMATLRLLEVVRSQPQPLRFYHAASSEIFGNACEIPQIESTPMRPTSPYGCAKAGLRAHARETCVETTLGCERTSPAIVGTL
jgi:GDPmannose 4,6-dehydratase